MFYEVFVNDRSIGVFGHPKIRNMHMSVSVDSHGPAVFVSAVCEEPDGLYFHDWLQHDIAPSDTVEFRKSASDTSAKPRNRYKMPPESESSDFDAGV